MRENRQAATSPSWWCRGLIFENCACTLVCPGHMHFSQLCTHERCKGYWAFRFDEGMFGDVSLAGTKAVIVFDSPQRMIDGDWTQTIIVDESASEGQRHALDTILSGRAGGPWEKLGSFVGRRQATEFLTIELHDEGAVKRLSIADRLKAIVTQIRGRDKSKPVTFENSFNQIHAPHQVLGTGDTDYDDGLIVINNRGSHGLFSNFEWAMGEAGRAG
jgi:hypothetical protein